MKIKEIEKMSNLLDLTSEPKNLRDTKVMLIQIIIVSPEMSQKGTEMTRETGD